MLLINLDFASYWRYSLSGTMPMSHKVISNTELLVYIIS